MTSNGVRAMKVRLNNSIFEVRYLIAVSAAFVMITFLLFRSMYVQDVMSRKIP